MSVGGRPTHQRRHVQFLYDGATVSSQNGSVHTVAVTNGGGTVMSAPYDLTVNTPPAIPSQPANQTVLAGQAATFTVAATGTAPFTDALAMREEPASRPTGRATDARRHSSPPGHTPHSRHQSPRSS
jgi:hypothetical protein